MIHLQSEGWTVDHVYLHRRTGQWVPAATASYWFSSPCGNVPISFSGLDLIKILVLHDRGKSSPALSKQHIDCEQIAGFPAHLAHSSCSPLLTTLQWVSHLTIELWLCHIYVFALTVFFLKEPAEHGFRIIKKNKLSHLSGAEKQNVKELAGPSQERWDLKSFFNISKMWNATSRILNTRLKSTTNNTVRDAKNVIS